MEIRLTSEQGFCSGVRRAIELAENKLKTGKPLASLGAIVHNRQVMECLIGRGMSIVQSLDEASGDTTLLIPSHGVERRIMSQIEAGSLKVIDATCSIVRNAQQVAHRLHQAGCTVLVFGDSSHTEVKGLLSWAGEGAMATLDPRLLTLDSSVRRIGVLSQTTQSQPRFAEFLVRLMDSRLHLSSEIHVFNTICDATAKRQAAALQLAPEVDLMLVIGGYDSANTRHLAELCKASGVRTQHIESADDIDPCRNYRVSSIGVTGGASTPEWVIREVIEKLGSTKF